MSAGTLELPVIAAPRSGRGQVAARMVVSVVGGLTALVLALFLAQAFPPALQHAQPHCVTWHSCPCRYPGAPLHLNGNQLCITQHQSTASIYARANLFTEKAR